MHINDLGKVAELGRQLRSVTNLEVSVEDSGANFQLRFLSDVLPRGPSRQNFIRDVTMLVKSYSREREQAIMSELEQLGVTV